jgi:chitin disaccharide deacetylase
VSSGDKSETNKLLGYPDDARLLLVNADDFGMYLAINEAVVRAFQEGIVRSTSLMVPCMGASLAIQLLQENPDFRFGVHLSIIRDYDHDQWGPLAPKGQVPSLLDGSGNFYVYGRKAELLQRARLDEVEIEFRAQIEAVLATALQPTHLDWHSLLNGGRADVFDLTLGLAKEYGLALRVMTHPLIDHVQGLGLPTVDYDVLDTYGWSLDDKSAR